MLFTSTLTSPGEARALIYSFGDRRLSPELVDELIVPVVRRIENDRDSGRGAGRKRTRAYQLLHKLIAHCIVSQRTRLGHRPRSLSGHSSWGNTF